MSGERVDWSGDEPCAVPKSRSGFAAQAALSDQQADEAKQLPWARQAWHDKRSRGVFGGDKVLW